MNKIKIEILVATSLSIEDYEKSCCGIILSKLIEFTNMEGKYVVTRRLETNNATGIPALVNSRIEKTDADYLVFIHDDVELRDICFADILTQYHKDFSILGLAGSKRQNYSAIDVCTWDRSSEYTAYWSGFVAHKQKEENITSNFFGVIPSIVCVLDGLFLSFHVDNVRKANLVFDEQFEFHHYDLSMCLDAHKKGLTLSTIPLFVLHHSIGELDGNWQQSASNFFQKYKGIHKV